MSARHFSRHFAQETGNSPHEFIERARIDAARRLLEASDKPLKAVAYDCGFGRADRLRIGVRRTAWRVAGAVSGELQVGMTFT